MKIQTAVMRARIILCGILAVIGASSAAAAATYINGAITGITSTTVRMISYRQEQHSWQTSDGAIHLVVNLGLMSAGNSLALYSSFDGGATWSQMLTFPGADGASTSDGMLLNLGGTPTLLLAYATAQSTGSILIATLAYNSAAHTWTPQGTQTVFSQPNLAAFDPACAGDSAGGLWCAYTVQNLGTLQYQEQIAYRAPGSAQWNDTGLVFGAPDGSTQHSARPVAYTGGVGMLYTASDTMYWAYRLTGWPAGAPWVISKLYSGLPTTDPYGTHYSVAADGAHNLFLAFIANQQLQYCRYLSNAGSWGPVRTLASASAHPAYPQVTLVGGNVMITVNYLVYGMVLQSTDGGSTFSATQMLVHAASSDGSLDYSNPRMEAPVYAYSPVPVFQQYADGYTQGLMYFPVPVTH